MKAATIVCKDITKYFGQDRARIEVLKHVSFTAYEHQLILLMGPSGSGKSTLLSIIGGILSQDSGQCLVLDAPINTMMHKEKTVFRGKNVGFLFQSFNLIPTLSNIENAALPLILNGIPSKEAFEQAKVELEKMGLKDRMFRKPSTLSGGEQQRVAIVRSYIHKPKIILCDEPTSYLDAERGAKVMKLLQQIKNEHNCTIIVVTHDPRILDFADRLLKIDDGVLQEKSLMS
jgi:putative ABC transport system ATP-binding protein